MTDEEEFEDEGAVEPKQPARPRMSRDDLVRVRKEQEDRHAESEEAGEREIVGFILHRLHVQAKVKARMEAEAVRRTGHRWLTMDQMLEFIPNFPIYLGYRRVHHKPQKLGGTSTGTLPELFNRFQDAPFIKPFEEFYETAVHRAHGRCIGMLFPRLHVNRGLLLHDGTGMERFWTKGFVCVYNGGTPEAPTRLLLQPFGPLIEAMAEAGFKPDFAV